MFTVIIVYIFKTFFPEFIQPQPDAGNHPLELIIPGNNEKIYNIIDNQAGNTVTVYPEISHDKVKELLAAVEIPDSYYWYYESFIYSARRSRESDGILKFENGDYRIEIYSPDGNLKKTVIETAGSTLVQTYESTASKSVEFSAQSVSAFSEAGVPEAATFISSGGEDYAYSLIESEYGTLLYAEFTSEKDGYRQNEEYYISLDYGIVVQAYCYENDMLIYSLKTTALYKL